LKDKPKLKYVFHNPKSEADTEKYLLNLMIEVNMSKIEQEMKMERSNRVLNIKNASKHIESLEKTIV
jgi:hypothetical protein